METMTKTISQADYEAFARNTRRSIMDGIKWTRKAASWSEIPEIDPRHLQNLREWFDLDRIEIKSTYPCSYFRFAADLEVPQYFVALVAGRKILVNTEGATYARYTVALPADF